MKRSAFTNRKDWCNINELCDGTTLTLNGVVITPFRLAQDYAYGFLLQERDKRVLIIPDELYAWQPPEFTHGVDPGDSAHRRIRGQPAHRPAAHPSQPSHF